MQFSISSKKTLPNTDILIFYKTTKIKCKRCWICKKKRAFLQIILPQPLWKSNNFFLMWDIHKFLKTYRFSIFKSYILSVALNSENWIKSMEIKYRKNSANIDKDSIKYWWCCSQCFSYLPPDKSFSTLQQEKGRNIKPFMGQKV